VGNHPDDRMQPEVVGSEYVNAVWRWANAELQQAREQLERDKKTKREQEIVEKGDEP
jgi:hypothetical protein